SWSVPLEPTHPGVGPNVAHGIVKDSIGKCLPVGHESQESGKGTILKCEARIRINRPRRWRTICRQQHNLEMDFGLAKLEEEFPDSSAPPGL
ncbi:MAG TPA: hypothetical protein VIL63_08680, partial [Terriglobales bacterium]